MTAFLFIPTPADARLGRRVDFGNIASLFAEADEPPPRHEKSQAARIGLMILILLGTLGDLMLVARPDALANGLSAARPMQVTHRVASF